MIVIIVIIVIVIVVIVIIVIVIVTPNEAGDSGRRVQKYYSKHFAVR